MFTNQKLLIAGVVLSLLMGCNINPHPSSQVPQVPHPPLVPPPSNFSCGPHTLTYVVENANGNAAGIRCVKLRFDGTDHGMPQYELYWYGEGHWGGNGAYRHVGYAAQNYAIANPGSGIAADIYGNGEVFNSYYGNLLLSITEASQSPSEIHIGGAWNETWKLRTNVQYTPLPRPSVCGPNFKTYEVKASSGTGPVTGVRCVLTDSSSHSSYWLGSGSWDGYTYTHLGSVYPLYGLGSGPAVPRPGQASDLCYSSAGMACNTFPDRSIIFTPTPDNQGFIVTGAWNEYWHTP